MELYHYGILGQKWGKTNGPPYPLDYEAHSKAEIKLAKKDAKWIKRKEESIKKKTFNKSEKEMKSYVKELSRRSDSYLSNGKLSATYVNNYNRKLAEVMNKNVGDITSPSGKVVRFVAKRGELGVYTALADAGYDMNQVKNGVWSDARVGYKKNTLGMIHSINQNGSYLIHYGIEGQKKGVRNGPPYPLKRDSNGNVIHKKLESNKNNDIISELLDKGEIKKSINKEKQEPHLEGPKRDKSKSLLYGTLEDSQKLVDKLSNTGRLIFDANDNWTHKEAVQNDEIIGELIDGTKSKAAMILYSKTGTHIYPKKEDQK